jgi:ribonuclease BN (tRNA processing enzyme)
VKVTIIGCSPAWPNPGGAQSGYLIENDRGRLLVDCGPGVLPRLRLHERWPSVNAIVVTHLHLDHWGDLVPWVYGVKYGTGVDATRPELWLPPDGAGELLDVGGMLTQRELLEETFGIREYDGSSEFEAAGFAVTPFAVPHYKRPSYALRITNGARVLAYSADCGPSTRVVAAARDADLFLCEATLDGPEPEPRGHLTVDEAVAASTEAGARRLVIVHRPAELPLDDSIERGYDGQEFEL